jgi:hypothetical protein
MSHFTNLPFELWAEIARNVVSKKDLGQLRIVNSTFNVLATPVLFDEITIRNDDKSSDGFWSMLHAPHVAQHVRSIEYVESTFAVC